MNLNLKALTAVASVAALTVFLGAPNALASPSEWDDQNSDTSWTSSSPVVAPATDPVETEPPVAPAKAPPAPLPVSLTPPPAVSIAPAPRPPSIDAVSIPPKAAEAVDITSPATSVPAKLTTISKASEARGSVLARSPYVHSD